MVIRYIRVFWIWQIVSNYNYSCEYRLKEIPHNWQSTTKGVAAVGPDINSIIRAIRTQMQCRKPTAAAASNKCKARLLNQAFTYHCIVCVQDKLVMATRYRFTLHLPRYSDSDLDNTNTRTRCLVSENDHQSWPPYLLRSHYSDDKGDTAISQFYWQDADDTL